MKFRIGLVVIIIFLHDISLAQKNTAIVTSHIGGGIGTISGNIGRYYYQHGRAPRGEISPAFNYWAGVQGAYMFTKYVGITTGVAYDQSAWKYETSGDLRKSKTTSQNRIQIPLLIRFENPSRRKRGGYFFHVGVNVSYLQSIQDYINGPIARSIDSEFNKTTFALQANMGMSIKIDKSLHWIVGVDGQRQLSNNYTSPGMTGYLSGLTFFTGISLRY